MLHRKGSGSESLCLQLLSLIMLSCIEQHRWDLAYLGSALKLLFNISCFFNIANEAKSLALNNSINYFCFRELEVSSYFSIFLPSVSCLVFTLHFCCMHFIYFCDLWEEGREGKE